MTKNELTIDLIGKTIYRTSCLPSLTTLVSKLESKRELSLDEYVVAKVIVGFRRHAFHADRIETLMIDSSKIESSGYYSSDCIGKCDEEYLADYYLTKEEAVEAVRAHLNLLLSKIKAIGELTKSF